MKKWLLSICMVLALVACKEEKDTANADPRPIIKLGVMYPMSGDSAFFGDSAKNNIQRI